MGGAPADKASRQVGPGEPLAVAGPPPRYVGRGGQKLEAALEAFDLDVRGLRVLDAGASTGGFTDCLLQHGARWVLAVDVGRAQLHQRLRADDRVTSLEQTDVRDLDVDVHGGPVDLVVADLSFISLRSVLGALLGAARPGADLVLLVKPQFEAGRRAATQGRGVIRDPALWRGVLEDGLGAGLAHGAAIMACVPSPLTGADGNVELLLHVREGLVEPPPPPLDVDAVVRAAARLVGVAAPDQDPGELDRGAGSER